MPRDSDLIGGRGHRLYKSVAERTETILAGESVVSTSLEEKREEDDPEVRTTAGKRAPEDSGGAGRRCGRRRDPRSQKRTPEVRRGPPKSEEDPGAA